MFIYKQDANSASDTRSFEQELRQKLITEQAVDVMVAVGPNMFYTVTLPCTLWFLDRGKKDTSRSDKVILIAVSYKHLTLQTKRIL